MSRDHAPPGTHPSCPTGPQTLPLTVTLAPFGMRAWYDGYAETAPNKAAALAVAMRRRIGRMAAKGFSFHPSAIINSNFSNTHGEPCCWWGC